MMSDNHECIVKQEWLDDMILEVKEEDALREGEPSCDVTLQIFDEPYNPPTHSLTMMDTAALRISQFSGVSEVIKAVSAESFDISPFISPSLEVVSPLREPYYGHDKLDRGKDDSDEEVSESANGDSALDMFSTHAMAEKYIGSMCEYTSGSGNFEVQMKTDYWDEARPYACELCNYRCSNAYHLKRHLMTHSEEKPFACSFCDYKSYRADKVKRHARTHTGEKPFACLYCDYRANRADHLTAHLRSHTRKHY